MKTLKIYLTVVGVILLLAVALGVYVWYTLQRFDSAGVPIPTPEGESRGINQAT